MKLGQYIENWLDTLADFYKISAWISILIYIAFSLADAFKCACALLKQAIIACQKNCLDVFFTAGLIRQDP